MAGHLHKDKILELWAEHVAECEAKGKPTNMALFHREHDPKYDFSLNALRIWLGKNKDRPAAVQVTRSRAPSPASLNDPLTALENARKAFEAEQQRIMQALVDEEDRLVKRLEDVKSSITNLEKEGIKRPEKKPEAPPAQDTHPLPEGEGGDQGQ
ncbi:hypothetical protein [Pseudomonas sp. p1(2021b)]|uniref:hypothetical protein n=1 Tax=Pseudomonas sp. p1(2021b) TaxID=2874628 RepID=UPI003D28EB66